MDTGKEGLDFTEKDERETKATAKTLAYLVRNIFNVGYELKARSSRFYKNARLIKDQAARAKSPSLYQKAQRLDKEAQEYAEEAKRYIEQTGDIIKSINSIEVPENIIKRHIVPLEEFFINIRG